MRQFYFFYLFFICHPLISVEYVYPVASYNEKFILYIHQTSPQDIQLFQWNISTNQSEQLLWSLFKPAQVQLLPNNEGFSFIDNGRLRIKLFHKRAPKAIDFDEPIYNISSLQWIDEHTCYCSAQYNNHFVLCELNDNGSVKYLISDNKYDYMYPHKINNHLFYISRDQEHAGKTIYKIIQSVYKKDVSSEIVYDFYEKPIIFLNMISEKEGFVIEHEKNVTVEKSTFNFFYHHIVKKDNEWSSKVIFSFTIPTCLFLENNDQRLFESILPLLPRIYDNQIHYVNYSYDNHMLEPYYYDLFTMQIYKIPIKKEQGHVFVPFVCGTKKYYGGVKHNQPLFFVF